MYKKIYVVIGLFLLFLLIFRLFYKSCNCEKFFNIKRKDKQIQLGIETGTPNSLKKVIKSINKLGTQLEEDSRYDTVSEKYLEI